MDAVPGYKMFDLGKYAGNTSNRLIPKHHECSKCHKKKTDCNFHQVGKDRGRGYLICGECSGTKHQGSPHGAPFDYKAPEYKWRVWMRGKTFKMKNQEYKLIEGTWKCIDGVVQDAIMFMEVKYSNATPKVFVMTEEEFFSKVPFDKLLAA